MHHNDKQCHQYSETNGDSGDFWSGSRDTKIHEFSVLFSYFAVLQNMKIRLKMRGCECGVVCGGVECM